MKEPGFHWSDPRHGAYAALKVLVIGIVVCVVVYLGVNQFDAGELTQVAAIITAIGAIQFGHRQLKKRAENNGE